MIKWFFVLLGIYIAAVFANYFGFIPYTPWLDPPFKIEKQYGNMGKEKDRVLKEYE